MDSPDPGHRIPRPALPQRSEVLVCHIWCKFGDKTCFGSAFYGPFPVIFVLFAGLLEYSLLGVVHHGPRPADSRPGEASQWAASGAETSVTGTVVLTDRTHLYLGGLGYGAARREHALFTRQDVSLGDETPSCGLPSSGSPRFPVLRRLTKHIAYSFSFYCQ